MLVTCVQADNETAERAVVFASCLRDAHPVSGCRAAVRRTRSAGHRSVPGMHTDVAFGRVVGVRDVRAIEEERDAGLMDGEPLLEAHDVREFDKISAADE